MFDHDTISGNINGFLAAGMGAGIDMEIVGGSIDSQSVCGMTVNGVVVSATDVHFENNNQTQHFICATNSDVDITGGEMLVDSGGSHDWLINAATTTGFGRLFVRGTTIIGGFSTEVALLTQAIGSALNTSFGDIVAEQFTNFYNSTQVIPGV